MIGSMKLVRRSQGSRRQHPVTLHLNWALLGRNPLLWLRGMTAPALLWPSHGASHTAGLPVRDDCYFNWGVCGGLWFVCLSVCMCVCLCACVYMCVCMCVCVYTCVYMCVWVCVCVQLPLSRLRKGSRRLRGNVRATVAEADPDVPAEWTSSSVSPSGGQRSRRSEAACACQGNPPPSSDTGVVFFSSVRVGLALVRVGSHPLRRPPSSRGDGSMRPKAGSLQGHVGAINSAAAAMTMTFSVSTLVPAIKQSLSDMKGRPIWFYFAAVREFTACAFL